MGVVCGRGTETDVEGGKHGRMGPIDQSQLKHPKKKKKMMTTWMIYGYRVTVGENVSERDGSCAGEITVRALVDP